MLAIALASALAALLAVPGLAAALEDATAPAKGGTPQEEKSFTWDLSWAGWRGLQYELRQRASIGGPDQVIPYRLIDERVGLKGRFGGKLAIDGAAFFTTGSLPDIDNGVEVRQANPAGARWSVAPRMTNRSRTPASRWR